MRQLLLLVVPFIVLAGVAIVLSQVDVAPGTGFAALCLISVLTGVGIGLLAARPGGSRRQDRAVATASRRAAPGAH